MISKYGAMAKLLVVFIVGGMVKLLIRLHDYNARNVAIGVKLIHKCNAVTLLSRDDFVAELVKPWVLFQFLLTLFILRDKARKQFGATIRI
jgi:hypothetical protein